MSEDINKASEINSEETVEQENCEQQEVKKLNKGVIGIICGAVILLLMLPFMQNVSPEISETPSLIDLTDLYESSKSWEEGYKELVKQIEKFTEYAGQLSDENKLLECLKLDEEINKRIEQLSVYTTLVTSLDQSDQEAIGQKGKIGQLLTDYVQKSEFVLQELGEYSLEDIEALQQKEGFKLYKDMLESAIEVHEEGFDASSYTFYVKMMSMLEQIDTVYEQILYADDNGMNEEVDYSEKLQNRQYSLAALYNMEVSKEVIFSQTLGYDNVIEYLTDKQGVDVEVYETAKEEIKKMKPLLKRYIDLRSSMNVNSSSDKYSYDHVPQLVQEAYEVFGPTYTNLAKRAFEENWIDPFKAPHKVDGAFAIGTYNTHPYIVLNYEETPEGLGTVAHELGHGIHYELARNNQAFKTWQADIFASEIASLTAEKSVYETIYQDAKTTEEKKAALVLKADSLFNTLFYQMAIAEFEEKAYKLVEDGETLTAETLNRIWEEANKAYYEESYSQDGDWASISHIFENFYTFQYATDFVAAEAVLGELIKGNEQMQTNWIKFLKSGGERTGYELTRDILGIDLTKPEYYEKVGTQFAVYLDELESIINAS